MFFSLWQQCNICLNCTLKTGVEQNFVTVLKQIQLPLLFHSFTNSTISEHKTTKVMICTYGCWLRETGEREIKQDESLDPVRSVRCAVSRKNTQIYKHLSLQKPVWTSFRLVSRTHRQCQVRKWTSCTGFRDVTSAALLGISVCQKKVDTLRFGKL